MPKNKELSKFRDLDHRCSVAESNFNALQSSYDHLKETFDILFDKQIILKRTHEVYKEDLDRSRARNSQLIKDSDSSNLKVVQLENQLKNFQNANDFQSKQFAALTTEHSKLKGEHWNLENKLKVAEALAKRLQSERDKLAGEVRGLQSAIAIQAGKPIPSEPHGIYKAIQEERIANLLGGLPKPPIDPYTWISGSFTRKY